MDSSRLPTEKQFALAKYREMVKGVARNELEDLFIEVMRQKMVLEEMYVQELKKKL